MCGAWVGQEEVLTGASSENPKGFLERRDVRDLCDALLHAGGFDWWKVSDFDLAAIPDKDTIVRKYKFRATINELESHGTWAVKEPRLCLLFPLLRDVIPDPVCVIPYRNPVEVAESLRTRNGFGIMEGLALWETYTRSALQSSQGLRRFLVSYEKLVGNPHEEVARLFDNLEGYDVQGISLPNDYEIDDYVSVSLRRHRAEPCEVAELLRPSQRQLWDDLESGEALRKDYSGKKSGPTLQSLRDLELRVSNAMSQTEKANAGMKSSRLLLDELTMAKRENTSLESRLEERAREIDKKDRRISAAKRENASLESRLEERAREIDKKDRRISAMHKSTSWRLTRPMRVSARVLKAVRGMFTGQREHAKAEITLVFNELPRGAQRLMRVWVKRAMKNSAQGGLPLSSSAELRSAVSAAETAFSNGNFDQSKLLWSSVLERFSDQELIQDLARLNVSLSDRLSNLKEYKARVTHYKAQRESEGRPLFQGKKIVIYTAISAGYDTLKLPATIDDRFDYVVFTDSPMHDTGIWQVRPMSYLHEDNTRSARFVKTHPHMLLQDYDVAVWIDSNISILGDISELVEQFMKSGHSVGAVPHPIRNNVYEEVDACHERSKDVLERMRKQVSRYANEGFKHDDLIESNFMIFDLAADGVAQFLNVWWSEIDHGSKRDQISLNYALRKSGQEWHRITEWPQSIRNHPLFALVKHDGGEGPSMALIDAVNASPVDPYAGPTYAEVRDDRIAVQRARRIDVVVCVHNALDDVRHCLESIKRHRKSENQHLILIDDGSEEATARYLRDFSDQNPWCELHRNEAGSGYTKAANQGLRASTGEFVLLLNSDTVVTDGWAEKLADAVFSTPGSGVVGPMSSAASHQSIPEHRGGKGQTAMNDLPPGFTANDLNLHCERWTVENVLPRVPLVHGFCLGLRREVIESIGYFDEEKFPKGYGEENDYCFRATDAGFGLVIATHTYVYHVKSKSYTGSDRVELMKRGGINLREAHGVDRVESAVSTMQGNRLLQNVRENAKKLYFLGGV